MIPYIIECSHTQTAQSAFHIPSGFCYALVRVLPDGDLVGQIFEGCFSRRCSSAMNHQCVCVCAAVLGCRVEMKQTVTRVFKMVATAIKVEDRSSGWGCFFHHSRSPPAVAFTCLSCGLTPRLASCCKPLFFHEHYRVHTHQQMHKCFFCCEGEIQLGLLCASVDCRSHKAYSCS